MTSHDWLIVVIVYVATSVLSSYLQKIWPAPDPSTKRIIRLERRVSELSRQLGLEETPLTDVQELIAQGRKINAIKLYREQTGVGLREAKEAVDAMEAQMKALDLA